MCVRSVVVVVVRRHTDKHMLPQRFTFDILTTGYRAHTFDHREALASDANAIGGVVHKHSLPRCRSQCRRNVRAVPSRSLPDRSGCSEVDVHLFAASENSPYNLRISDNIILLHLYGARNWVAGYH